MASESTDEGHEHLRADARRKRDQILAAARVLFVGQGAETPMEEIARRAGVGVGTLYRRFPQREVLLKAVALDLHRRLADTARTAWEQEPNARSALGSFLRHWAELRLGMLHSELCGRMPDVMRANPEIAETRQTWLELLDLMVKGAQAEGAIRDDIGSGDIIVLMNLLIQHLDLPGDIAGSVPGRFLELMLDGLRAPAGSALTGEPITRADLGLGFGDHE